MLYAFYTTCSSLMTIARSVSDFRPKFSWPKLLKANASLSVLPVLALEGLLLRCLGVLEVVFTQKLQMLEQT